MALGKTINEVRSLSYVEYCSWKHYYALEPWGFHDAEYRTAAQLTMLYNINSKRANQKDVKDFIRDMPEAIGQAYQQFIKEQELSEKFKTATREEKARMIARTFGGKIDNRRNNLR